jgi:membrane protease YdiL (CAAX protease family)
VIYLLATGKVSFREFGLKGQPMVSFIVVFIIATLSGLLIDQNGSMILSGLPGYRALGRMPTIESPMWHWLDLTFGLILVGIFEELIFRGYMHSFLSRFFQNHLIIIGLSAVAFGFIHWSGGLHKIIITGIIGAIFMALYVRTRSLPAIMLAHFAINFIDFSGFIPKGIFWFY